MKMTKISSKNTHSHSKPLILAIETSGRSGSVAIARGQQLLAEKNFSAPMKHGAELFPATCRLLDQFSFSPEQIEHIYISIGPGSFTGLRIAVTTAKMMNLVSGTKIVAVDTLDVIAANIAEYIKNEKANIKNFAVILDAKRTQFYTALYQAQNNQWTKILDDCLLTAPEFIEQFTNPDEPVWLLGEGLVYYADTFKSKGTKLIDSGYWNPLASKVHQIGWQMALKNQFTDVLSLAPAYLRRPIAK